LPPPPTRILLPPPLPKMLPTDVWTPKQALSYVATCFEPLCVKLHQRVTSIGESGEKNKNKNERPYISRIRSDALLPSIGTNFGLRVRIMDVIYYCAKVYRNRLRGLDCVSGRSLTIPTGLRCRR